MTPPSIPALPSPKDSFSSTSGDKGKQRKPSSFCHFSGNLLAEAQRGLSFPNPSPWTIRKFGIPFIPEVKLHRSSLAAGWGFSLFYFSFYWTPALFLMQGRTGPGKHTEKENPSSLCSLSSLSRQLCEQHLGHQRWVDFDMLSKV